MDVRNQMELLYGFWFEHLKKESKFFFKSVQYNEKRIVYVGFINQIICANPDPDQCYIYNKIPDPEKKILWCIFEN